MKLDSLPLYPISLPANSVHTNLVLNKTCSGEFQIARVLKPGGPHEGEFEVLFTSDSENECREFALQQVEKDFPGLLNQS